MIRIAASAALAMTLTGSACAKPVEISFQLIDNRVFMNGHGPFSFILDTGASGGAMSLDVMRALHLTPDKAGEDGGAGEGSDKGFTLKASYTFGDVHVRNEGFFAQDFSPMNAVIGFSYLDGIVGQPVFAHRVVDIDFAQSHLRLFPPGAYSTPQDAVVLPFTLYEKFMPEIDAGAGALKGRYLVDLGDR